MRAYIMQRYKYFPKLRTNNILKNPKTPNLTFNYE